MILIIVLAVMAGVSFGAFIYFFWLWRKEMKARNRMLDLLIRSNDLADRLEKVATSWQRKAEEKTWGPN